jgi:hypothetical protein
MVSGFAAGKHREKKDSVKHKIYYRTLLLWRNAGAKVARENLDRLPTSDNGCYVQLPWKIPKEKHGLAKVAKAGFCLP